ncbi:MAG: proteasome accessory factor PafA2 family protein [Verrucomicrobia bacterium]|nr:proteasome accessory factor PafA2 family protein [Verrucomicrobiota bacterium]
MTPSPNPKPPPHAPHAPHAPRRGGVPKLLGADVELGNLMLGVNLPNGTGAAAARALLREIDGLPLASAWASRSGTATASNLAVFNPQDWGRKYQTTNGGCVYIDLDHLELCPPETLSARDHAAAFHAMLRIARTAQRSANARLPDGLRIVAVVNNNDAHGHSYGSHLNVLITRPCWNNLFQRRMHYLLYLASYQVSSIVFAGQGKVGADNGTPRATFVLSQRADFFECLTGSQTTYHRPLVNSRDEALCGDYTAIPGPASDLARLHCIFYDANLCPAAIVLKTGVMQIILSLIEAGQIHTDRILEDPLETALRWSHDPHLQTRARLLNGQHVTALDLQRRFFDDATRFVERGGCDGIVPDARDILALWGDTLDKLAAHNLAALTPRLDWVLKLSLLQRALQQRPELNWTSPELKHLDFSYASLDDGLFWACQQSGAVDPAGVTEERIQHFTREPPDNTRAWTRTALLRLAEPGTVDSVDWDSITFRLRDTDGWSKRRTVSLPSPLEFTRPQTEAAFQGGSGLDNVLDLLGVPERDRPLSSPTWTAAQGWALSSTACPASWQPPEQPNSNPNPH